MGTVIRSRDRPLYILTAVIPGEINSVLRLAISSTTYIEYT